MTRKISRRTFLKLSTMSLMASTLGSPDMSAGARLVSSATAQRPIETGSAAHARSETVQTWPRAGVPRERTLVLIFGVHPEGIGNPYANGYTHQRGGSSQMEGLFYYTALNDKTYPWLAEGYAYNDDATQCTLYIRRGVKWNDGEVFNAHDVVFTYQMLKQFAPGLRDSSLVANAVQSVIALDDYTVRFTLNQPDYRFHFTLCTYRFDRGVYLVPEHVFSQFTTVDEVRQFLQWDPAAGVHPVHTGPYQLAVSQANSGEFHLRYEWWAVDVGMVNQMPAPEVISSRAISSTENLAQMIINDEVDVTLDMRPTTIASILAQASDHVVSHTGLEKPYGYVDWWPISVYPNNLTAPYDNADVRWALAYAIDQQQIVDVAWDGAGQVAYAPFPNYPGLTRYVNNASAELKTLMDNVLKRDLAMVDELMTGAGFTKDGEGFWVDAAGERPACDVYAGVPLFSDIAPITAEQLLQAGFDSTHAAPPDVWTLKGNGQAELHLFGHGGSVRDPYTTLQMYHSQWQRPTGQDCGQNRPRWANAEYDALVETMGRTSPDDTTEMQQLFNQAMGIWYRELPEVPLVQWFHRIAMNTTYWRNWPTQNNPYNTAYWHLTFPITLWNLLPTEGAATLAANYDFGSPGSTFAFEGTGFPAHSAATISLNSTVLPGTVQISPSGGLRFQLDTTSAEEGVYVVVARCGTVTANVVFTIAAVAPLHDAEGLGPELIVPAGIALTQTIHLPLVANKY